MMNKIMIFMSFYLLIAAHKGQASDSMNGIKLDDYENFEKEWKLVTVRFRKDTNELRFVYANSTAEKALDKNTKVFPDGSVFAKVAYMAQSDPAFEASLGPSQQRRVQLMVKNQTQYRKHRGWGYALFDTQGKVYPEPIHKQVAACASCHDIVPERDYVFSRKFNNLSPAPDKILKFTFKTLKATELPETIRKVIPKNFTEVQEAHHKLITDIFQGTLDEVKPILAQAAVNHRSPVIFTSKDYAQFVVVYPEDLKIECDDEGATGLFVVSVSSLPDGATQKLHFCQPYSKK